MNIKEFFSNYTNHPVLFIGTGISLRYLTSSYTWDGLLKKISFDIYDSDEPYLDIKAGCQEDGIFRYEKIASKIEKLFNEHLIQNRKGKFEKINDLFYRHMEQGVNISRFKLYISECFKNIEYREDKLQEITELKKTRKNIGSIITTNYDKFIEQIFNFHPLIGNGILLSNPYGSVYKIHGCVSDSARTIITSEDYENFNVRYELIRAQLLSLFIHNPIIFMGYNIGDRNIKDILKTIFTYVELNTEEAEKIRKNFLLIEYDKDSTNEEVIEHDIDIDGMSTIRINKLKTDNFSAIYAALSELHLPISAMDVRKVQGVVKEIYSGGSIKVHITEDLDSLPNGEKIIAIGSSKTISYQYQTTAEMMQNYFKIIDEYNYGILSLIDKHTILSTQYFPIFGFSKIRTDIEKEQTLKIQQVNNLRASIHSLPDSCKKEHYSIKQINDDPAIAETYKENVILWSMYKNRLDLAEVEEYLRNHSDKRITSYRKLLCQFDYAKYSI